jgi:hypothetical protein
MEWEVVLKREFGGRVFGSSFVVSWDVFLVCVPPRPLGKGCFWFILLLHRWEWLDSLQILSPAR